ncbi:hypothetical protein CVT24_011226 [Panaeolus cyanescens]|uniref:Mid2 domain-containing protein n=1 Tax=Panaeolus cyanescens TaxID=181874 RepID=A0A409YGI1_9AGAR|nr:hypothetical protein CVT24_011226 [Panaeolus cyanescens]
MAQVKAQNHELRQLDTVSTFLPTAASVSGIVHPTATATDDLPSTLVYNTAAPNIQPVPLATTTVPDTTQSSPTFTSSINNITGSNAAQAQTNRVPIVAIGSSVAVIVILLVLFMVFDIRKQRRGRGKMKSEAAESPQESEHDTNHLLVPRPYTKDPELTTSNDLNSRPEPASVRDDERSRESQVEEVEAREQPPPYRWGEVNNTPDARSARGTLRASTVPPSYKTR